MYEWKYMHVRKICFTKQENEEVVKTMNVFSIVTRKTLRFLLWPAQIILELMTSKIPLSNFSAHWLLIHFLAIHYFFFTIFWTSYFHYTYWTKICWWVGFESHNKERWKLQVTLLRILYFQFSFVPAASQKNVLQWENIKVMFFSLFILKF